MLLFADAKILEDVPEDFVGGDFADDGAKVVEGFADVLGAKVCGDGAGGAVVEGLTVVVETGAGAECLAAASESVSGAECLAAASESGADAEEGGEGGFEGVEVAEVCDEGAFGFVGQCLVCV